MSFPLKNLANVSFITFLSVIGVAYSIAEASSFKRDCLVSAREKSPDAPFWHSSYFCNCAEKEYSAGNSLEATATICTQQIRAFMRAKGNDCVAKIGRENATKSRIRECLDKE